MKNHRKKEKKNHYIAKFFGLILLLFTIATLSIVLYDMYINIDSEDEYTVEKVVKEISIESTNDISSILEEVSKSVVRDIEDRNK